MPKYVPRLEGIMHDPEKSPCYMPKYVPRLEGIMHDPEGECIMPSNLGTYFGI
jgi:hypothetical protein